MHDETDLVFVGLDFPQFLDANAVGLGIGVVVEPETLHQLLAEMAAAAFGKEGVFAVQFHARLEVRAFAAIVQATHVAGGDSLDRAVFIEQHLGAGKAGIDFDAQRLGLLAQPAADVAERDDIVAFIVEAAGKQGIGHLGGTGFRQYEETVFGHGGIERCAVGLPVGQQFIKSARVEDSAGQDVGADFRPFLDQADRNVAPLFACQLLQANCRCQSGRAAANDDDIELHGFTFHDASLFIVSLFAVRYSTEPYRSSP